MSSAATTEPSTDTTSPKHDSGSTNGTPVPPRRSRRPFFGEWVRGLDFLNALFVEPPARSLEDCMREVERIRTSVESSLSMTRSSGDPRRFAPGTETGALGRDILAMSRDFKAAWEKLAEEENSKS